MKTILATLALLLFAGVSQADSVWTYTGNSTPDPLGFHNPCGCALSGSVTFDAAWNPLAWDFTDGIHELTQADSTGTLSPIAYLGAAPFTSGWTISLLGSNGWVMRSINYGSPFEETDLSFGPDSSFAGLSVQGNQGVWTDPPVSTPEPGTLLLLGAGLVAALTFKRLA